MTSLTQTLEELARTCERGIAQARRDAEMRRRARNARGFIRVVLGYESVVVDLRDVREIDAVLAYFAQGADS